MRIEIRRGGLKQVSSQKKQVMLNAAAILKYLVGNDEKIETMIMCKDPHLSLATTDNEIYNALGSLKPYDSFKINRLTKFFENVDVRSFRQNTGSEKPVLTFERADELRKSALNKKQEKQNNNYGGK